MLVNAFNSSCVSTSGPGTIVDDEVVIEPAAFWVVASSVVPKLDWSVVTNPRLVVVSSLNCDRDSKLRLPFEPDTTLDISVSIAGGNVVVES